MMKELCVNSFTVISLLLCVPIPLVKNRRNFGYSVSSVIPTDDRLLFTDNYLFTGIYKVCNYNNMKYLYFIFSSLITLQLAHSIDKEMTVNIGAGKEECFYEIAKKGDAIDIEYQVIDGGHGDLDITFRLADPTGRILIVDFKKPDNNHRADAKMDGDYRFCFDNTFSSYNTKTVFFELIIENENDSEWDSEENPDGVQPEMVYEIQLQNFEEILNEIKGHLKKAKHFQDLIKSSEARDRNIAEENYFKVNTFSLIQLVLMLFVGIVQVFMVKSLFDDRSRVNKIWKNLDKGLR